MGPDNTRKYSSQGLTDFVFVWGKANTAREGGVRMYVDSLDKPNSVGANSGRTSIWDVCYQAPQAALPVG